jgi:hypothetical protein
MTWCIHLYEKQGREKQFVSAAERDTYLQQELAQLQASAKQTADVRLQVDQQVADLGSQAMDMSQVPLLCCSATMHIITQLFQRAKGYSGPLPLQNQSHCADM